MVRHLKALQILKKGTVIPATPLALDENRNFDEYSQRLLMKYYLNCGVGGIATAVHSTQFEIRDPKVNLFEPILKLVSEEITDFENKTGKVIVKVAGVCGKIGQAVAEAKLAQKYGYDAVLLSPGGLNDLSEDEFVTHTKAVAEIIPVIGFYLQTAVGGRHFSYKYWQQICEIPNVVAIKVAPFNRYMSLDVVRAVALSTRRDEITLYTGNDDNIVIDLLTTYKFDVDGTHYEKGFEGGLLGHWSVWTKRAVELFELCKKEKSKGQISAEMLSLANAVIDSNAVLFDGTNGFAGCIPGLHYVLKKQGLMKTLNCINPNEVLSCGQAEEIERIYDMYPQLVDDDFVKENIENWKSEL
ncbi:MAG: dihydrodipicolinate synthase family protein [Clostridia bacterium]|nr:dihydrodipicolinate synthase family protein [Clostridia bacterium]